ncbi:hypothetical protein [Streptomyces sp. NPDC047000]|uniref:hypothetical protein n=1 Tax=Streptomyces sp. NPDC047000 TaxID=3155474 RepID=UPI0033DBDC2E
MPPSRPTPWSRVEEALREQRVTDVLVPGRIDRDDAITRFTPQPLVVFVVLDEGALRLESAGRYDHLDVRYVDTVTLDGVELFEDVKEEGDEVALASLCEQLFGDGWDRLRCTSVRRFTDTGVQPDPGEGAGHGEDELKCLALQLEYHFWVFFNPTWTFGIRIGNAEDMRRWERGYGDHQEDDEEPTGQGDA